MTDHARATEKQIATARALFKAQIDIPTIIEVTGLTRRQIGYQCGDMPTPKHPRERDCDEVQADVDALAAELGHAPTSRDVGELLGVTRQCAHALMKKCGTKKVAPAVARQREANAQQVVRRQRSARDVKIIALRKADCSRSFIAERLGVSVSTVGNVLRAAGVA
jgi:hypothetical protein